MNLPGVSAEFRAPDLHLPTPREVARAIPTPREVVQAMPTPHEVVRAAGAAATLLPPRDKLLYYGGLGVAAAVGVIEWPVAVAVGAGVALVDRSRRAGSGRDGQSGRRDGADTT